VTTYDIVRQGAFKDYHTVEAESPDAAAQMVARGVLHIIGDNGTQWFYEDFSDEWVVATIAVTEARP
jgi:hypothetical protein